MKVIHISDLHFGTENTKIVEALQTSLSDLSPNLIVISGDFTQVGNEKEFRVAQEFLRNLPCRALCVPGNHDVPAYNMVERFFSPYKKYKEFITEDPCPVFEDENILVAGLNSARRALPHWNWANGAISEAQCQQLKNVFKPDEPRWTICTFHHPIHKVDDMPLDVTVFGRKRTLQVIQDLKIDLVLTGHVHHASMTMRGDESHQTVYLSASTALSSRTRGQENGFNVITLGNDNMIIEVVKLENSNFNVRQTFKQRKTS